MWKAYYRSTEVRGGNEIKRLEKFDEKHTSEDAEIGQYECEASAENEKMVERKRRTSMMVRK